MLSSRALLKRVLLLGFGLHLATAFAQQPIVVGMSAPLSGANADFGREITEGAQAYFRKLNADGGINGRPVSLVVLDDRNDRATAGNNARKLATENKAIALFGFASATLSLDAIPVAQSEKLPIVAPFTGADNVRKAGLPVYLLRASYAQEFDRLASHWASMGFSKAAVVHYDDEVGKQNFATAQAALAKQNKVAVSIPIKRNAAITQNDLDAVLKADTAAIINTTLYGPFSELLQRLRESKRQVMASSLSFVGASQLVDTAKANAAGVIVAHVVPFPRNLQLPVVRECVDAITAAGYGTTNFANLESCISAKALAEALKRAKTPVTRETLTASLDGFGRVDLGGYVVNMSGANKQGANYVDLSIINRQGTFSN